MVLLTGRLSRITALVVFAAGFLLLAAGSANAQETTGTITIHSRICLNGEPTSDIFTECHDSLPTQTTSYSIDGGTAQVVDASGNLSFTDLAAGPYEIAQVDGVPLDFAHLRVFCSDVTAGGEVEEIAVSVQKFTVNAVAGDEVVCDVYTIPENASGLTPTPTATTTPGTTTLPNTGAGQETSQNHLSLLLGLAAVGVALLVAGFSFRRMYLESLRNRNSR